MKSKDRRSTTTNKSVIAKLRDEGKVNDETLVVINSLQIEDLIALKLELAANHINNRLYGFDIWKKAEYIIKDSVLKFAVGATKSKKDAARFLAIPYSEFQRLYVKFNLDQYFLQGDPSSPAGGRE